MFHRKHCQRAAFFAPIGWLRESKESGTVHRNTERPRNAAGEGMFRLNTVGVLLRGAGLCGRRYSRRTYCHEPHGGTVSNQTKSRNTKYLPESVETINCKPSSASTYKWMAFYWEPYVSTASFSSFLLQR
ncbi:hypothetical protein [Bacteroides congonensis]